MDKRAQDLAKIICDWSLKLNPSDILVIQSEPAFQEFVQLLGGEAKARNVSVRHLLVDLDEERNLILNGTEDDYRAEGTRRIALLEGATARARIDATVNPHYLDGVPAEKKDLYHKLVNKPVIDRVVGNGREFPGMKWCLFAYPGSGDARAANMTEEEYADFVYSSTNVEWSKTRAQMEHVKKAFDDAGEVHILVPGMTDLRLSLKGRGGDICDGIYNLPDGEVYYGPVEDSLEGYITFPYASTLHGTELDGVRLSLDKGFITSFDATKNKDYLESIFSNPDNRRIGEFGIGCNQGIQRYTNSILFDEKMGGSIHLAIGESYPHPLDRGGGLNNEGNGKNPTMHWDMICDLRPVNGLPGGELSVDGKLVQKDGKWLI